MEDDDMRTVAAGEFKAKCLAILDEVNATGEPVLVTKRGKPVARVVVPNAENKKEKKDSIFGFLKGMATIPDGVDLVSSEYSSEEWDRMFDENWDRIERENLQRIARENRK
jgi:prevent-host-death family protein